MSEAINIRKEVAGEGSPAESPEFASGEPLSSVKIDKTHLVDPENNSVPKASDVRRIASKLEGVTRDETKVVPQVGTNVSSGYVKGDGEGAGSIVAIQNYKYLEILIPQGVKSIRLLAFSPKAASSWNIGYAFGNLVESEGETVWENVFSSRFEENGVANTAEEREIPVEDGAAYFRVTCQVVYNNTTYLDFADFYCYLRSGDSVKDLVDNLAEGLAGKLDTSDSDDPDNLNSYIPAPNLHHYLDRDGKEMTSNNVNSYGVTDFIPVDDMFGIICNNSYNSSVVCGCAVYSTNDESGFLRANTGTISLYKEIYAKKEGDAFVRFTLYNSSNIWIRKYNPTRLSDYTETPIHDYQADKLSAGTTVNGIKLFELSESVNQFDKTNNFISKEHLYINEYGNLVLSNNAETIGVTGFIPFGNHGKVTIKNGGLSGALRHCTYDANFVKKRDVLTSSITKAEDEYYVRFTVKSTLNADTCVIYYDNNAPAVGEYPPYSPQPHFNEKLIPKKPITVDDFSPTVMEPASKNLCNPAEIVNGYIRGDTGVLVNSPSNNSSVMSCSATGYIPIDEEGLYCEISKVSGEIVGYAYYTDKTSSSRIDGYYKNHKPSGCSVKYAAYIEGAKYVRFTIPRGSSNVMVSRGAIENEYVEYKGFKKVLSPDILPDNNLEIEDYLNSNSIFTGELKTMLPAKLYCVRGDILQLFYKGIVRAVDLANRYVMPTCSVGTQYRRYFELDASLKCEFTVPLASNISTGDEYTSQGNTFTVTGVETNSSSKIVSCRYKGYDAMSTTGTLDKSSGSGDDHVTYSKFSDKAPSTGNRNLSFTIYDDNRNIIGKGSTKIQVVKYPKSPDDEKHILCIGSSTTEGGKWVCEAQRRLLGTGGTPEGNGLDSTKIKFVGSMTKELYGQTAHFFAKSGWAWEDYATKGRNDKAFRFYLSGTNNVVPGSKYTNNGHTYTVTELNTIDGVETILCTTSASTNTPLPFGNDVNGTLTLSSGSGDTELTYVKVEKQSANPFWNEVTNHLDFQTYFDENCGGNVDIMYCMLGTNQLFSNTIDEQENYIRTFVDQLHSEYPFCTVVLIASSNPSTVNMMPGYGADGTGFSDTYSVKSRLFDLYEMYKTLAEETRVVTVDGNDIELPYVEFESWMAQFDTDYNYPLTNKNVNTRNSDVKEPYANNTIHPGDKGYMQFADSAYRSIVAHLCQ